MQTLINFNRTDRIISRSKKRSMSYHCAVLLIIFTVYNFYCDLFVYSKDKEVNLLIFLPTVILNVIIFTMAVKCKRTMPANIAILSCLFLCFNVISYLITKSGFYSILILMLVLMTSYIFIVAPLRKNEIKRIFWLLVVAIIIIWLNTSIIGKEEGKFNSNTGGLLATVLFSAAVTLFIVLGKNSRHKRYKYLLICILSVVMQFVFGSRTAMLGSILYTFAIIFLRANRKTFNTKKVVSVLIFLICFGILIAYFYAEILPLLVADRNIMLFGKKLFSGRETIWHYAFESIQNNLWFGVGGRLNEKYAIFNPALREAHNQPLGILAENGIFVFILFYLAFVYIIALAYRSKRQYIVARFPAIYMAIIIIMSYFETYFNSRYTALPIMTVFGIIMSVSLLRTNR